MMPLITGKPADLKALEPDVKKMVRTLDFLESYFLKNKPYICGDEISIADIFGVNEVLRIYII